MVFWFFLYPVSTLWGEITIQEEKMRAKSLLHVFAAFRRHIIVYWAKLLRDLLKCRAIIRLYCLDPQRALDPTSLQRLPPTGRIVAEIRAAPSAFAGRINRHTPVGIAHQAEQPALRIGAPARDTRTHGDMLRPWPGYLFLRLRHNSKQ
jgi:hypothetical protein